MISDFRREGEPQKSDIIYGPSLCMKIFQVLYHFIQYLLTNLNKATSLKSWWKFGIYFSWNMSWWAAHCMYVVDNLRKTLQIVYLCMKIQKWPHKEFGLLQVHFIHWIEDLFLPQIKRGLTENVGFGDDADFKKTLVPMWALYALKLKTLVPMQCALYTLNCRPISSPNETGTAQCEHFMH